MNGPARFITFEGAEGTGKSTQAALLSDTLTAAGLTVLRTREPGGTPGAEALRALLLGGQHRFAPLAEALLHAAARADHVTRAIRPALTRGAWVVCDRFFDSTAAYQGAGQSADQSAIATLRTLIGLTPDLTVIIDLPPDLAAARIAARGLRPDRYEQMDAAFHARVAAAFRAIAVAEPQRCVVVDGSGAVEEVRRQVWKEVKARGFSP